MTNYFAQSRTFGLPASARGRWIVAGVLLAITIPLAVLAVRSQGLDFRAFYVAARSAAVHLDPYTDNQKYGEQFADVANEKGISRWIYPPPALFFVTPLAIFSYSTARLGFVLLSIAALLGILFFLGRRFHIAPIWLAVAGLGLPVIACVERGQIDLLILFCVVAAYRLSGRLWAGIPLGIAISIKIFPAALLLWWLMEKRFKEVATAILFTFVIGLFAAFQFGVSSYAHFLHNLTTLHSQAASGSSVMPYSSGPWLSFSPGFVGSYNNPLILLDNAGIFVGLLLTVASAVFLYFKRVSPAVGFFSMVLISQLMNTALWTMGMVMYLPICLLAISKVRSNVVAVLLLVPFYLPSQIRVFGVTPRLILALLLVGWFVTRVEVSGDPIAALPDHSPTVVT